MHVRMLHLMLAILAGAALYVASVAAGQGPGMARGEIKGEGISGSVELREVNVQTAGGQDMKFMTGANGVEIVVNVTGLKPGTHGVHIHAVGKCEAPSFDSAGGHFDPGPHGFVDPDANHPFHMGDLPNLVADATGRATVKALTTRVTLAAGPLSIFDADGSAIIVHANPDQGVTGSAQSGVSGGPRVACAIVTSQK